MAALDHLPPRSTMLPGPRLSNLTGTSWTAPAAPVSFQANFTAGSGNSVGFFNATTSAPDVDHITVSGNGAAVTKIVAPYVDMGMGSPLQQRAFDDRQRGPEVCDL